MRVTEFVRSSRNVATSSSPEGRSPGMGSIPGERRAGAVVGDPALEEILLLTQVDGLAHPGEGVARAVLLRQADAFQAAIGDVAHIVTEEIGGQAEHAARQAVLSVGDFELDGLVDTADKVLAEDGRPKLRVFLLDAVDEIDAEVQVGGFVAQDVLELLAD